MVTLSAHLARIEELDLRGCKNVSLLNLFKILATGKNMSDHSEYRFRIKHYFLRITFFKIFYKTF